MIRLANVWKTFNIGTASENQAVKNINLTIRKREFVTIIGSNGAGKTTLFNLIAGNEMPTEGSIFINDRNVTRESEYKRARYIGRIFQNPLLGTASNMTLEDNMVICSRKGFKGLRISLNRAMRERFMNELVNLDMGLELRLKDNVGLLSGGQRQALTLLMMVLSNPALVLLDEHTAALDPKNAALVLDLTKRFIERFDLTTVMITHNMSHAIEYGTRLLMMDRGEIILDIEGEEKRGLTVEKLVRKFHDIRRQEFDTDESLLSE